MKKALAVKGDVLIGEITKQLPDTIGRGEHPSKLGGSPAGDRSV